MGQTPTADRLQRCLNSPNYRDGSFQNLEPTPMMAPDVDYWAMTKKYTIDQPPGMSPEQPIKVSQPDYSLSAAGGPNFTWLGHSTYVLQWPNLNVVVDPVFSRCSPVSWVGPSPYPGTDSFSVDSLPKVIDVLVLTHDHYDHLDYQTIIALLPRVKTIVTSLGVGEHLEYWGCHPAMLHELDWWETYQHPAGFVFTAVPARHFSGRGFVRNKTLWSGFMVTHDQKNYLIGGDSGYGAHFKTIGERFKSVELAMLECGQYNKWWEHIHMMPDKVAQAAKDLNAKAYIPVHWGKFTLSLHPWQEPPTIAADLANQLGITQYMPLMGQSYQFGTWPTTSWLT